MYLILVTQQLNDLSSYLNVFDLFVENGLVI